MAIPVLPVLKSAEIGLQPSEPGSPAEGSSFLGTIHAALDAVSKAQNSASGAEAAVAAGKPGASQATALVLSDRAELGWTGVVAVRNEVVSAYQTLTNMQI